MAALQRRDWARARTLLAAADAQTELAGEALDGLAEAAMWIGEYESSLATRQRAHAAFVKNGNLRRAALTAIALALHYAARLRFAVAAGWYGRAERFLADQPEGAEQGYLAWTACLMAIGARQQAPALDAARRTFKIGLHTGDLTLQALGITFQGYLLVRAGDVDEGLRMLDEGMAAAVGGTLAPFPTSLIFCRLIDTCQQLGDYQRAAEWLEAIDNSPITACITSYPGDCDTHRAQLLVGRGAWSEAEQLVRRACASMQKFDVGHAGLAFYQLGEVRLRTGDLAAAEAAFARAAELGTVPQPGAALLDRRNGRLARAAETLAVALADERGPGCFRRRSSWPWRSATRNGHAGQPVSLPSWLKPTRARPSWPPPRPLLGVSALRKEMLAPLCRRYARLGNYGLNLERRTRQRRHGCCWPAHSPTMGSRSSQLRSWGRHARHSSGSVPRRTRTLRTL
jgi:tetratricopeptide (TPR) repeat protein